MPPLDVLNNEIYISALDPVAWALIADITDYDATHSREDPTRTRVFGQANPHVRPGEKSDEYGLNGLYNLADTNGQNVIRAAYDSGTPLLLRVLFDGVNGYYQQIQVTEYGDGGEADGEYITVSFAFTRDGEKVYIGTES